MEAVVRLIKIAISSGTDYSYFHFLQGSDIPIKSQDEIHKFFEKNNGIEFIQIEKHRQFMAFNKAYYIHIFCHNRFYRTSKILKLLNFSLVYLQKIFNLRINTDIELHQGSALFSITNNFAKYILDNEEWIQKRFRWGLAVDEVFIQSLIMNSSFKSKLLWDSKRFVSHNVHLIDRSRPDGKNSPHIWRSDEFDYIISSPERFCFARKFDENVDIQIVEKIKDFILNRNESAAIST